MTTPSESQTALITADQLAKLLQISTRSVWRLKSAGKLPSAIALGGSVRWIAAEVLRWIESGCPSQVTGRSARRKV